MLFSVRVATFFRLKPSIFGLILCLALALLGELPRACADNSVDKTGQNFFVETKTGHVGIDASTPASAINAGAGEVKVGSSGVACTLAMEGAIRYTDKKLQFCDGAGWRSVSTASTPP